MNQASLDLTCPAAANGTDPLGFEIGFDHARLGLVPTGQPQNGGDAVAQGWQAGHALFGQRPASATRAQRCWLELRLAAWRSGRPLARLAVTPPDLQQIDAGHCPVTRRAFATAGADAAVAVCLDAGQPPAMGRLAVLSRVAAEALPALAEFAPAALQRHLRDVESGRVSAPAGLDAEALWRLASMLMLTRTMDHAQAAAWPLRAMPTTRLQIANPVQRLQWLVTRQFASPGWSVRLRGWAALIGDRALRTDFQLFVGAFAPRVLEHAGQARAAGAADDTVPVPVLEGAWADARVQRRWQHFATQLGEAGTRALLEAALARGLVGPRRPTLQMAPGRRTARPTRSDRPAGPPRSAHMQPDGQSTATLFPTRRLAA